MQPLCRQDPAYIQAVAFGRMAEAAAPEIIRLLKSARLRIRRVVDVGRGTGPLSALLVEVGFEVTRIDISAELLAIARTAVPRARCLNRSAYETPLPACAAIIALGEALTYHAESADADSLVESFFRMASAVLPAGGMLIFDVIENGEPSLVGRSWSSGEDWAVLVETREHQSSRTLFRNIETHRRVDQFYGGGSEVHRVRLFDRATLVEQLAALGFATETAPAYGTHPLAPRRCAFISTRMPQA